MLRAEGLTRLHADGHGRGAGIRSISLQVERGGSLALAGPSGCGKTTLLHVLGLLDAEFQGALTVAGQDVRALDQAARARLRLTTIGFVFQSFYLVDALDVRDNIALPHWRLHGDRKAALRRAEQLLDQFGLLALRTSAPQDLSGGEQQRVALARALANEPALLLADEPTGNLDSASADAVLAVLTEQVAAGRALVVASHDHRVIGLAQQTLRLRDGQPASQEDAEHRL